MKKKLIVLGILVVFGLLFLIASQFLGEKPPNHQDIAKQFAENLIVKKDTSAAYALVSEDFKTNTPIEKLTAYVDSIRDAVPSSTVLSLESSTQLYDVSEFSHVYQNSFTFALQDKQWIVDVVTIELNEAISVQRYNVHLPEEASSAAT